MNFKAFNIGALEEERKVKFLEFCKLKFFIGANRRIREKVVANKFGLMALYMKDSGVMIKRMARVD